MDKIAQILSVWFGSTPFILIHIIWFTAWMILHFTSKLDPTFSTLTVIVSLEAIFLALFILRAENIESERIQRYIKETREVSKKDLAASKRIEKRLTHIVP